jgi:predicted metal-dependent phosphoesterase TrpH
LISIATQDSLLMAWRILKKWFKWRVIEDFMALQSRITIHALALIIFLQHGLMREDGLPVDNFLIIPGQEITTRAGHLLALGVRIPDLKGIDPADAVKIIHDQGGIAVPPHPYDYFRAGIREAVLDSIQWDALEVFNAATTLRRCNHKAYEYALAKKLPMTAGSDAHHAEMIGVAYTILEVHEFSVQGVLQAIRKGSERMDGI